MESAHPFVPPHVMLCEKGPTRCPKTQDSIETLVGRSPWTCTQGSDFWSHIGNRYLLGREALSLQAFWTLSPRDNLCLIFFSPRQSTLEGRILALPSVHLTPQASPPDRLTAC